MSVLRLLRHGNRFLSSVPVAGVQLKRSRLLYQSRKRGILETDLLLSVFADKQLASMNEHQLDVYSELLDENDWDIYYWITGKKELEAQEKYGSLIQRIRDSTITAQKTDTLHGRGHPLRMPPVTPPMFK